MKRRPLWLVDASDIRDSPSRADGMSEDEENYIRRSTCDIIFEVGNKVLGEESAVNTAMVLFNRYVCRCSMVSGQDCLGIAIACILIAGKATDYVNASRATLKTLAPEYISRKEGLVSLTNDLINNTREKLAQIERHVLFLLEYDIDVELPHLFIQKIINDLIKLAGSYMNLNEEFLEATLKIANDFLKTSICVQYDANTLAILSIKKSLTERKIQKHEYDTFLSNKLDSTALQYFKSL